MKPFNLEEYLKDPSRKLVTRDGKHVRVICTDRETNDEYTIIVLAKDDKGVEWSLNYDKEGKLSLNADTKFDLFFAPEKERGLDKHL